MRRFLLGILGRTVWLTLLAMGAATLSMGQQVVQRGALGVPSQVYDETQQWTNPIPVAGDPDQDVYIPDVSNTPWLERNYADFENKGVYTASFFTQYKKSRACRRDVTGWGLADAAHLDACIDIGYRVREISVDTLQKTVTLIFASMVSQDGLLLQDSTPMQHITRRWAELDPMAVGALTKTTQIVADQMAIYDRKMRGVH